MQKKETVLSFLVALILAFKLSRGYRAVFPETDIDDPDERFRWDGKFGFISDSGERSDGDIINYDPEFPAYVVKPIFYASSLENAIKWANENPDRRIYQFCEREDIVYKVLDKVLYRQDKNLVDWTNIPLHCVDESSSFLFILTGWEKVDVDEELKGYES
jgi:hypothetical protein